MLHVVLLILKILGIILLSIVLLLLLIIGAVLFVSVTYRVEAKKKDMLHVTAAGGWMFRMLTLRYVYDGAEEPPQELKLRLFGITVLDLFADREKKERGRRRKRKKKEDTMDSSGPPIRENTETESAGELPEDVKLTVPPQEPSEDVKPKDGEPDVRLPEKIPWQKEGQRASFARRLIERIRGFFSKIIYAFHNIRDKIENMKRNVEHLRKRKDDFLEFWNLEEHVRARSAIRDELLYLWRKSRPKKIKGQVRIGFDDPSVTGMCVGALSALYAWYPGQVRVIADFEEEVLEGDVLITGRIRLYTAALVLLRVWFNKDIRHMYEHWQQL